MKPLYFLVIYTLLFLFGCESETAPQKNILNENWIVHWGSDKNDIPKDMAIGKTGIYITGVTLGSLEGNKFYGGFDIFLSKYNFEGEEQWTRQWGTKGRDEGMGVIVDSNENIFVTGYVKGSFEGNTPSGDYDVFLLKTDSEGRIIWTRQWGSNESDQPRAISSDESGIYITGFTKGALYIDRNYGKSDIFLVKTDYNGNVLWAEQWGTKESEWGIDLAAQKTGIYITGFTQGNLDGEEKYGFDDIFLVKYNLAGSRLWTRQWGTSGNDEGNSIYINSDGIYTTGRTGGDLDGNKQIGLDDIFITKHNPEGIKQWTVESGSLYKDNSYGITGDSKGNIYITGFAIGAIDKNKKYGYSDVFIGSYSPTGEKIWLKQFGTGGFDFARSIALDDTTVYVTGDSSFGLEGIKNTGDNRDIFLGKWNFQL